MRSRFFVALVFSGCAVFRASAQVPAAAEFRVNTATTDSQSEPWVAADARGNFVVVWESRTGDGSESAVLAQRYDATGLPRARS